MLPLNQIFRFDSFRDARGELCVYEGDAAFSIRRVFWIRGVPADAERANHASIHDNKIVVLNAGSCMVALHDGVAERSFALQTPMDALVIPAMTWNRLYAFSPDCVLTVLADRPYVPGDVITDFDAFIAARQSSTC